MQLIHDEDTNFFDETLLDSGAYTLEDPVDVLPRYLADPPMDIQPYGTLAYNKQRKVWVIQADPITIRMAKRMITGCGGRGATTASIAQSRRGIGELNWFMQRYPLTLLDAERYFLQLNKARTAAIALEQIKVGLPATQPVPGHFVGDLMHFQQLGLSFLLHTQRALLADDMGLGKTVQSLAWLCNSGAFPAIIVCPPHLVRNWMAEIERFLRVPDENGNLAVPKVHVLRGLTPYALPKADIYISHYLLLRGWKKQLPKAGFAAAFFDEVQELRNKGTEKYSAASLLSQSVEHVYGLSGTPIYNRGGEIWSVINAIDFHALGDWESFTRDWCYGYGGDIVTNPQALGEHLRQEGLMLRRTKEEVLQELPPKRRLVAQMDSDEEKYRTLIQMAMHNIERLKTETQQNTRRMLIDAIAQADRQATGIAKAEYVSAFVKGLIDAGERVLLFAHHHNVMDIYRQEMAEYRPVFITGRETEKEKQNSVNAFMDGETSLCCISLRSASGLNLQAATCVVFGELDWSPAVHAQAEDRAHRIGQKDSILCYYLVASTGSDEAMQQALGLKVSQFMGLMGEEGLSPEQAEENRQMALRRLEEIAQSVMRQLGE